MNRLNFDDLTPGSSGLYMSTGPNGAVSVSILPGAQVALGSASGLYAAPYLSSDNGDGFGTGGSDQANGIDLTPYLSTGRTQGSSQGIITLSFAATQKYLGLLWGSVDTYNHISFFMDSTPVGTVSGNDPAFAGGNGGDQGLNGTRYVNINSDSPSTSCRVHQRQLRVRIRQRRLQPLARRCSGRRLHNGHARRGRGWSRPLGAPPEHNRRPRGGPLHRQPCRLTNPHGGCSQGSRSRAPSTTDASPRGGRAPSGTPLARTRSPASHGNG